MTVERLRAHLRERNLEATIREYDRPVETVEAAAQVAHVPPNRIVKSLVLMDGEGRPRVCQIPGHRRLSYSKARRALGVDRLRLARPDEVRQATGFAVGGVPPVGYPADLPVWMDASILEHEEVVAGGGSGAALVVIPPVVIQQDTDARIADLSG